MYFVLIYIIAKTLWDTVFTKRLIINKESKEKQLKIVLQ